MSEACKQYSDIRKNRCLKHGELSKLCKQVDESWSLQKGVMLPETICTRCK